MSETGGKLALLKQQARQAVATAPGKAMGEAARQEIEPVMRHLEQTMATLSALPDALALQVSPILSMAERLDHVLSLQRKSLAALHEESLTSLHATMDPTAQRIEASLGVLAEQGRQVGRALQGMQALPGEIRDAAATAQTAGRATAEQIQLAASRAVDGIKAARRNRWSSVVQAVLTAFLVAGLTLGGMAWLGTHASSWRPRLVGQSAKEQAWDSLYQQAPPVWRQSMDQFLATSAGR